MSVVPEEDPALRKRATRSACCPHSSRDGRGDPAVPAPRIDEFDYGYALTVHKAQGSQWDRVVLFDESYAFREHRGRWLYTGLTRAAQEDHRGGLICGCAPRNRL